MGLGVATRAFFKLLVDREMSESVRLLLDGQPALPAGGEAASEPPARPTPPAGRSDAISLLAALQREARLVDLVTESLGDYSDQQVGAAAREVLEESGKVIERMFGLQPLTEIADGNPISTPDAFDPAEYRLTGKVAGDPPYHGQVAHHGWRATRCEIPAWSGSPSGRLIVAPVEIEIDAS